MQQFQNHSEILGRRAAAAIEPVQRLPVFLSEFAGNPYNYTGLEACSVGYQLSKMRVVGLIELVFDDHALVTAQISGQNVHGKITYSLLTPNGLKVESENLPD